MSKSSVRNISPESLNTLSSRVTYLIDFVDFTPADVEYISAAKTVVASLLPDILRAVYTKLLTFDITAKAFLPRNTDYTGETAQTVEELSLTNPQVLLRQDFLKRYLVKLVSITERDIAPNSAFWRYLDNVGIMHTGEPGFKHRIYKPELRVEYVHMGLLLAFVMDLVVGAVMNTEALDTEAKTKTIQAFNKIIWIQNDLFARHYVVDRDSKNKLSQTSRSFERKQPAFMVFLFGVIAAFVGIQLAGKYSSWAK